MELGTLIQDFYACRSNKRRTVDSMRFDLHRERDLVRLHEDFENRDLPTLLYSFIATHPRYREVNACLMQGKVIQYHFDTRVRPLVEAELTDRTFNNRVGFGPDVAINQLLTDIYDVSRGYTRDCWVFFCDVQAYFPSANLPRSYAHYRDLLERNITDPQELDELLYILLRTTWSYTALHTHLRSPRWMWEEYIPAYKSIVFNRDFDRGASLGNQHWQVAQNYDLNDFDHLQVDHYGLHYGRFVDDMWWVFEDREQGKMHMKTVEKDISAYGYHIHPNKRYCQHFSKGGSFISTPFKPGRVYASRSVVNRARMKIRFWNKHVGERYIESFLSCMNSYFGKMKRVNAYGIIRDLVEEISPRWWRYCFYNDARRCIMANIGYRRIDILQRKYKFKYHSKNEKGRNHYRNGFTPLRQRIAPRRSAA